ATAQDRGLSNKAELELRNRKEAVIDGARRLLAARDLPANKIEQGGQLYTVARRAHNAYIEQLNVMIRRGGEPRVNELQAKYNELPGLADKFMKFVEQNTRVAGAFDWIAPSIEGLIKGGIEIIKYWRQRSKEDRELKAETLAAGTMWPEWDTLKSR